MSNSCNSSLINLNGGRQGSDGSSSYTCIAFADSVTLGPPDVVVGFSPSTPLPTSEWIAIRTSSTPFNCSAPGSFQGYWVNIKGDAGVANLSVYEEGGLILAGTTQLDFAGSEGVGVDVTAPLAFPGRARVEITTAGLFRILQSTFLTRQSSNELKPGAYYWICDTIDSDGLINAGNINTAISGVIVRAITTNTYDSQNCILISRVPDRAQIEYNLPFSEYVFYSNGDYTEAYNEVYVNISGALGALYTVSPAADTTNWQYVLKNTAYYVTEINGCSYDVAENIITKRWDSKGNVITNIAPVDSTGNEVILQCFRWGHYDFSGSLALSDGDTIAGNNITIYQNFSGVSSGRKPDFTPECKLDLSTFSYFRNNIIDVTSNVFLSTYQANSTQIINCNFVNGSSIDLVDTDITPGATIAQSVLKNTIFDATSVSRVWLITDKSNIFNNCRFTNVKATFENCQYTNSKFLDIVPFGTNTYIRDVGNNIQNINTNITNSSDNILKDTILTNCSINTFTYNTTQNLVLGDYSAGLNMSQSVGGAIPTLNYTVDTNLDIYSGANFGLGGGFTALTYAAGQATITVVDTTGILASDIIYLTGVTGTSAAVINNKYWIIASVTPISITFTCPALVAGLYTGGVQVYFPIEQTSFTTVTNNKITDSIIRGINKTNRVGTISNNTFKEVVWQNYSRTVGLNSGFLATSSSILGIDAVTYPAQNTYGAGTEASGTIRGNQFTKTGIYNSKLSNFIVNNFCQEVNFYYALFTAGAVEENVFEEIDINNVYITNGGGYLYRNRFSRLNNITNCGFACLFRDNKFNAYSIMFHPATGNASALNSVSFKAGSNQFSYNIFEGFSNVGAFVYDIPSTDINQSFSNNIFKDCPLYGGNATYNFDRFNHRENRIVNLSYAFFNSINLANGVAPNPLSTGEWDLTITTRSPHLYKINEVISYTISTANTTLAFQIGILNTIPAIIPSTSISGIGTIQSITNEFVFTVRVRAVNGNYFLMDNANSGITGAWGSPTGANNNSAVLSSWNTRSMYYENPSDYECGHRLVTRNEDNDLTHRINLSLNIAYPKFYYAEGVGGSTAVYNPGTKTLTLPVFVRNMAGTIILGGGTAGTNYDIQYINNLETNFPVRFIAAPGNTITFITVDRTGGRPAPLQQNEILTNLVAGGNIVIGSSIDFTTLGSSQPLYMYDECWIKRDGTTSSPIGLNRIVKTVLN